MLTDDLERAVLLPTTPAASARSQRNPQQLSSFIGERNDPPTHPRSVVLSDVQSSGLGLNLTSADLHHSLSATNSMPLTVMAPPTPVGGPGAISAPTAPPGLLGSSVRARPKLRGSGGALAGVHLYRQRTNNPGDDTQPTQSQQLPTPRHARTHSVFSTRSGGTSSKDRGSLRYRRIQNKIYNILERPKDCRAISYHVLSFAVVFACLVLSIVQSADDSINLLNEISISVELLMLLWFTSEYVLRIWSAGCRSKYQSFMGRLRFARRPLCIVDAVVIVASVVVVVMNATSRISQAAAAMIQENGEVSEQEQTTGGGNMVPALRGLRFFQIMRMMRLDRRGSSWRLLSSVVWAHRQELFTAIYTGFLVLIFASFAMYVAERETNEKQFKSYADALWWGVITLCTVGYGDKVPQTAVGRVIGSCCAMIGISFFALPPGILGSGLALKVQQQARQKHQIRRRVPAAMLIQALWRMVGTEPGTVLASTWLFYINHQRRTKQLLCSGAPAQLPWAPTSVTDRLQMAAGRLVSRNRSFKERRNSPTERDVSPPPGITLRHYHVARPHSPEGSPTGGEDRERSLSHDTGPTGPLTAAQCNVIRAVRRMKFLVCRRKLRESMRPYDVKDVIEQYSSGHAEILSRLRQLQYRVDDMTMNLTTTLRQHHQHNPHQPVLPVGPQNSSPAAVGQQISKSASNVAGNNFEAPGVARHVASAPIAVDEEQNLQLRMLMLDRKLDMVLEFLVASNSGTGSSTMRVPPAIIISPSGQTPTTNSVEVHHHRPVPQVMSRSLPPTPSITKDKQAKETSSSTPVVGTVTSEAAGPASAASSAAASDMTTTSYNDDTIVVSGILLDNESTV